MTDQELENYSAEHLQYELWMLYETAARLAHKPAVHNDRIVKNALIESFTVHARTLGIFLYPEEGSKRADDVTSDEYVRDIQRWKQARGTTPPELSTVIQRTGKEIAHLTTKRHPSGAPQKVWRPEPIVRAFLEPLRLFAAHVPAGRLDGSVSAFIANLPASAAASPPPAPASAAASQVHGLLGSTSSPPGPITHYTDVSTP